MDKTERFADRRAAGKALARRLSHYRDEPNLLVLGLPRGGVPVAWEVAHALNAELDVLVVRKLGLPQQPELAMGAIASGGARVLNPEVAAYSNATQIAEVTEAEQRELTRRETRYRGDRPPLQVENRTVMIIDDGLATGATMEAAVTALRSLQPAQLVVAVPVAPDDAVRRLEVLCDQVICLQVPAYFSSVGQWYEEFGQTSDDEVSELLRH